MAKIKPLAQKADMLNALTSFRFLAALLVFVWHMHIMANLTDKYQLGYVGVGFFYLLSGFILTYVYYTKLASGSASAIKKFYIARIAKIYPTHLLTMIASIPLFIGTVKALFPEHTKMHFAELLGVNLTLLQSYVSSNMVNFSFNGVAWSISVEMFFYALFPILVYLLGRYASKLSVGRLILMAVLVWISLCIVVAPVHAVIDDWRLYIFPPVRLPEFIIGIILGLIYIKPQDKVSNSTYSRRRGTAYEVLSLGALGVGIGLSPLMPQSLHFAAWLVPFLAVVIYVFSQQRGYISQFLGHKLLVYLGEISFSFYMLHQLVIRYVGLFGLARTSAIVISLLVSVTLSAVVYRFYEEPMRVRVKRWLEKCLVYLQGSMRYTRTRRGGVIERLAARLYVMNVRQEIDGDMK